MANDVVIFDFETLHTIPETAILSVGMIIVDTAKDYTFNELVDSGIHLKINVQSQLPKRKIGKDTLDWWKKQGDSASAILEPSSNDIDIKDMIPMLNKFLKDNGYKYHDHLVYSRGSHFDFPILVDIARMCDQKNPLNHWNVRDIRTVIDTLLGTTRGKIDLKDQTGFVAHNALHDSAMDFMRIKEAIRIVENAYE